jgi:DNA-binding SARP family transcriptional activator
MNHVRIHVLGSVEIRRCDRNEVSVNSAFSTSLDLAPKPRLLLALFASNAGNWMPTKTLVEQLWPDSPIASGTKTLQGNILRLRRILGPTALLGRRGSYCLSPETSLDLSEFEQRADAIESSVNYDHRRYGGHQDHQIIYEITHAEALWRGTPFDNVEDAPMILHARQSLDRLRHRLRELRIDLLIRSGDVRSSVQELERCVESDPYREDYWAMLIRALYLSNRQSDALNAFGRARRILAAELGVRPGSTLTALEQAILRFDDEMIRSGEIVRRSPGSLTQINALRAG